MIHRLLDWLFGPRCHACGERVPEGSLSKHYMIDHPSGWWP